MYWEGGVCRGLHASKPDICLHLCQGHQHPVRQAQALGELQAFPALPEPISEEVGHYPVLAPSQGVEGICPADASGEFQTMGRKCLQA